MADLIVIEYDDMHKAEEVRHMLQKMQHEYLVDLADAVVAVNGTSALSILVRKVTPDKVLAELEGTGGKVLQTSLNHEEEAKLQAALSAAKPDGE